MIGAFNQVYKAFQGFLSQNFWYTVFVPIALFAAIHRAILTQFGWPLDLDELFSDTGKSAKYLLVFVAGLVLCGYVLQSFLPVLRGLLDGSLLPTQLHDRLRRDRLAETVRVRNGIGAALQTRGQVSLRKSNAKADQGPLRVARTRGLTLPNAPDEASVAKAEGSIDKLAKNTDGGRAIDLSLIDDAQQRLITALETNNSALNPPLPDAPRSLRLRQLHERFQDLLTAIESQAQYQYEIQQTRYRVADALDAPRATTLGDARYVVERYSRDVYAVNFDFLWPRLLVMLRTEAKDDPSLAAVDAARSRVDFAILCLLLTCSVPLAWLPAVLVLGRSGWLIPVVGGATPLALRLFYQMAIEGQLTLGETIKTTIDRHRFLVLKMLHQPVPATRAEERQLWRRIRQAEEDGRTTDLVYAAERGGTP